MNIVLQTPDETQFANHMTLELHGLHAYSCTSFLSDGVPRCMASVSKQVSK